MADGTPRPNPSSRFDRVVAPDPRKPRNRDSLGKEAIYSTAPQAPASTLGLVICERCDIESGIGPVAAAKLLWPPPVLFNPITRKFWAHCPACERRSWLRIRQGQALRALIHRDGMMG